MNQELIYKTDLWSIKKIYYIKKNIFYYVFETNNVLILNFKNLKIGEIYSKLNSIEPLLTEYFQLKTYNHDKNPLNKHSNFLWALHKNHNGYFAILLTHLIDYTENRFSNFVSELQNVIGHQHLRKITSIFKFSPKYQVNKSKNLKNKVPFSNKGQIPIFIGYFGNINYCSDDCFKLFAFCNFFTENIGNVKKITEKKVNLALENFPIFLEQLELGIKYKSNLKFTLFILSIVSFLAYTLGIVKKTVKTQFYLAILLMGIYVFYIIFKPTIYNFYIYQYVIPKFQEIIDSNILNELDENNIDTEKLDSILTSLKINESFKKNLLYYPLIGINQIYFKLVKTNQTDLFPKFFYNIFPQSGMY